MEGYEKEEKLSGGNVSNVFRKGNKVFREMKPDSDKVHQLLQHLEKKRFPFAPKFLEIDEHGREVLSYIEGVAGNYPLPSYMWSEDVLHKIAVILRQYHEAVSDFPFDETWETIDLTPEPYEVICHNDFAIYNLIFHNQSPVGIIDFDLAGPGPRLWDVAYALYTCVPLSRLHHSEDGQAIYYDSERDSSVVRKRVKLFMQSYGRNLGSDVMDMVVLRLEALCRTMERKALEGDSAFQEMIEEGHKEHYLEDIEFVQKHRSEWLDIEA
ncbi:phosphotransferase [Halobacillus salinus]|uniref:phosphotransferase n=1 Tax=Halobacillus salinus TaxID=192814 RepID=UPI0009A56541|nr:phosphotransferase [Halobacillus salinus]